MRVLSIAICFVQLSMRQGEHDALVRLLTYVQQPKADKGGPLELSHGCHCRRCGPLMR